tara:strand:- start:46 stop:1044 length:999 start_codon:yes stop_codon:yes gene_type:complete
MNLVIDLNRSLKVNPPNYGEGITFIDRVLGKRKDLRKTDSKGVSLQPRDKNLEDSQRSFSHSLKVNGILYGKQVMVVEACDDGVDELISGYGRDYGLEEMGVDTYFWDKVKFDSPYWKYIWKTRLNAGKDHIAQGTPNTEGTYIKNLTGMKNEKTFDFRDDDAVRTALQRMSDNQLTDKQVEKLLKKFRQSNSNEVGVIAMSQVDANKAAKKLDLPTEGFDNVLQEVGYVRYKGDFSNKIVDIINQYDEHGCAIQITGFIQFVKHDKIGDQRKGFMKDFNKTLDWMRKHLDKKYHNIVEFTGFLAQIDTKDKLQNGLPRERGLVNVSGKIIK